MRRISILLLVFFACFALPAWPQAPSQWHHKVVTFRVPGAGKGANQGTYVNGITSTGAVAGWYIDGNNVNHGFISTLNGTIAKVDHPNASKGAGEGTQIQAMNCVGATTGFYWDSSGNTHSFLRTAEGRMKAIDVPGAVWTQAVNINDFGTIQGLYGDSDGNQHYFLRGAWGNYTYFDPPSNDVGVGMLGWGSFYGLNNAGAAVGWFLDANWVLRGWLRTPDGEVTRLDAPGSWQGIAPLAINLRGEITGELLDPSGNSHGFVRDLHGNMTDFLCPAPYDREAAGFAMNFFGEIVGFCGKQGGGEFAFSRSADGAFKVFGLPGAGTGLNQGTFNYGLNLQGWLTGQVTDENYVTWSYVMIP